MKASDLLKQINYVAQAMSKNPGLPILEGLLFDNGYLIASDLETYIKVKTEVTGTFCIHKDDLKKILSKLPKGASISISIIDENKVAISVDGTKNTFKIATWTESEFPKIPAGKMGWIGTLTAEDTAKISEYVSVASTDDLKPTMNCICVSDEIAATDGHILFWNKTNGKVNTPVLFNKRAAKIASSLSACKVQLIPSSEKVGEPEHICVSNEDTQVIFRKIDWRFVDYKNAIPTESSVVVRLDRKKLSEQINNALIAANKVTHAIKFTFSKENDLKVFSEDLDFGSEYDGELGCEFHSEVEGKFFIGFNGELLLDVIGRIDADQLTLKMSAPSRACVINDCCLIMPIMLKEYTV